MKYTNKLAFLALALLGIGGSAYGHMFSFYNHTTKALWVQVKLAAQPYWHETKLSNQALNVYFRDNPKENIDGIGSWPIDYDFNFTGWAIGFCLEAIRYKVWDFKTRSYSAWHTVGLTWLDSQTYDKVLGSVSSATQAAVSVAKDIAGMAAGTSQLSEGLTSTASEAPSFQEAGSLIQGIGEAIKYSLCTNRQIQIVEVPGEAPGETEIKFVIQLL